MKTWSDFVIESLGLPSTAQANEIAVAAGKRLYLPPAVQKLQHAARPRKEKSDD